MRRTRTSGFLVKPAAQPLLCVSPSLRVEKIIIYYQRLAARLEPLEDRFGGAISRPGARLPRLVSAMVMLTGLARGGGLYVPESWPQLSPGNHRRLLQAAPTGRSRSR